MICSMWKKPKTMQERRENIAVMLDSEIVDMTGRRLVVRAKRVNLPTAWDDKPKSIEERCWKRHRYTQYR